MLGEMKIFSGSSNPELSKNICRYLNIPLSQASSFKFSEGNVYVKIQESVRQAHVFFIQSGANPINDLLIETLFFIDAFKRSSAASVTVILPYFPYTKGDKKDEPRVSIRAKVISEIIEATGADRVLTMDLQPPQIQGFFNIPVDNLYAQPVFCDYLSTIRLKNPIVVAPDFGAARMANRFATQLQCQVSVASKKRHGHTEEIISTQIFGDVKDKDVIIVDDMIISGGTLIEVAKSLKKQGALKIYACISHALLGDKFLENFEKSDINQLIITDSIPFTKKLHPKVKKLSVAQLFSEAISSVYHGDSISTLFKDVE